MLQQDFESDQFEIIVVNDSGNSLPPFDWQLSKKVQVVNTSRRERSVARNVGAAISKGRYLHFLDDDDWMAQGAICHWWDLSQSSHASWLYGITQIVDRNDRPITQLQHGLTGNCFIQVLAGEWIPLQASIIEAETFFKLGGFNQLITGPEDIDLLRRVALVGELDETRKMVTYLQIGEEGSTTDYRRHPLMSRTAREIILDSPKAFSRMRSSADTSYWHGRICRAYFTSALFNLARGKCLNAVSRVSKGLFSCLLSIPHTFALAFWIGVLKRYKSDCFSRDSE